MSVTVPRYLAKEPEAVVWAFRRGVVQGMRSRGIYPKHGPSAAVIAPTSLLRLADRVRREWMSRHPARGSEEDR